MNQPTEQPETEMQTADYEMVEMIEKANPSARSLLLAVSYAKDYLRTGMEMNVPSDEVSVALGRDLVYHVQLAAAKDHTQMDVCMKTLEAAEDIAVSNMI